MQATNVFSSLHVLLSGALPRHWSALSSKLENTASFDPAHAPFSPSVKNRNAFFFAAEAHL